MEWKVYSQGKFPINVKIGIHKEAERVAYIHTDFLTL
jgi:hypothetical protein